MTWTHAYLLAAALIAVPTAAALWSRPRVAPRAVFYLAVTVNETPFAWLAVLAAGAALTRPGGLALAAAALVAAGLLELARRGAASKRAVTAALAPVPVHVRWSYVRIVLAPLLRRRRTVEHVSGIAYGPAPEHRLDLYRSKDTEDAPVLVHFFGGGYNSGRRDTQSLPLLYRFAEAGWVCVSADYRLRPSFSFEDHLVDAKRVVAWVRAHGRAWGADPDRVVLAGSSAGAHLAASAAFTAGDRSRQPGFEDADTSVSAVVGFGGYYGTYYGRGERTSPLGLASPEAPPCLIVHGDRDTIVPVADARRFVAGLRDAAVPVVYVELPGGQHAFDLCHSLRFDAVIGAVAAFCEAPPPRR